MDLDYSLYPDLPEEEWPVDPLTVEEQADYLLRLCSSWDFYGFGPDLETLEGLANWAEAFTRFPLLHSPAFCALCDYHGFTRGPAEPYFGKLSWEESDLREGRELDPCLMLV